MRFCNPKRCWVSIASTLFDKTGNMWYNISKNGLEVFFVKKNNPCVREVCCTDPERGEKIDRNAALGYVYKVTNIRPFVISLMSNVPEYIDAIQNHDGLLTDKVVYDILKDRSKKILADNGVLPRCAKNILNAISKDVTGDSSSWKKELGIDVIERAEKNKSV